MSIRFELTLTQEKLLQHHFAAISVASRVGQKGVFVAQIRKDAWDKRAYVIAHFYPGGRASLIVDAVAATNTPNGWAGIPPVPHV